MEMWISRDEINVRAEEDVFKFILAISIDSSQQKQTAEIFRRVILPRSTCFASRDFLSNDIPRNNLVISESRGGRYKFNLLKKL